MPRSPLDGRHLHGRCPRCEQYARLNVDTRLHPHLDGKIGVRCGRCDHGFTYHFSTSPATELAYQVDARKRAEEHDAGLSEAAARRERDLEAWQRLTCDFLGFDPPPVDPDAPTPSLVVSLLDAGLWLDFHLHIALELRERYRHRKHLVLAPGRGGE